MEGMGNLSRSQGLFEWLCSSKCMCRPSRTSRPCRLSVKMRWNQNGKRASRRTATGSGPAVHDGRDRGDLLGRGAEGGQPMVPGRRHLRMLRQHRAPAVAGPAPGLHDDDPALAQGGHNRTRDLQVQDGYPAGGELCPPCSPTLHWTGSNGCSTGQKRQWPGKGQRSVQKGSAKHGHYAREVRR